MENDKILGDFDYLYITLGLWKAYKHKWIERFVSEINRGLGNSQVK